VRNPPKRKSIRKRNKEKILLRRRPSGTGSGTSSQTTQKSKEVYQKGFRIRNPRGKDSQFYLNPTKVTALFTMVEILQKTPRKFKKKRETMKKEPTRKKGGELAKRESIPITRCQNHTKKTTSLSKTFLLPRRPCWRGHATPAGRTLTSCFGKEASPSKLSESELPSLSTKKLRLTSEKKGIRAGSDRSRGRKTAVIIGGRERITSSYLKLE